MSEAVSAWSEVIPMSDTRIWNRRVTYFHTQNVHTSEAVISNKTIEDAPYPLHKTPPPPPPYWHNEKCRAFPETHWGNESVGLWINPTTFQFKWFVIKWFRRSQLFYEFKTVVITYTLSSLFKIQKTQFFQKQNVSDAHTCRWPRRPYRRRSPLPQPRWVPSRTRAWTCKRKGEFRNVLSSSNGDPSGVKSASYDIGKKISSKFRRVVFRRCRR